MSPRAFAVVAYLLGVILGFSLGDKPRFFMVALAIIAGILIWFTSNKIHEEWLALIAHQTTGEPK